MAMKLLTLLSITFSIFAAASAADQNNNGGNSIVGAAWSADQSKEDSTTEETHILLPENPESYIAMPELSPESYITLPEREETTSSGDGGDFILSKHPKKTCDKYPPVCREKSSPGPDCCKKKCTDIRKDPYNCGMCGHKCKHNHICCSGHCVDTSSDPRNCGRCGHKCKKWEICVYGMCSYA